jgi:RNA polymerase sigma-70 factor (ECF subfamily)
MRTVTILGVRNEALMPATSHPASSLRCCTEEDPSDEVLIMAAARGEATAQRAFVRRFQHRVYGLANAIVADPVQAEAVAEEALTRAWRQARTFDPHRGSAGRWILRMTRNLAVDSVRRQRGQMGQRVVIPLDVVSADERGRRLPDEPAPSAEESTRARAALRQIPAVERRAVVLATFYGYTATDISEADGISVSEARNRLRSGLMKLRALLAQVEPVNPATWRPASSPRQG